MMGSIAAALQQGSYEQTLGQTMTLYDHFIALDRSLYSHRGQHLQDRFRPVALLVGQTSHTGQTARALAECRKDRNDREKVRTIRSINIECLERSALYGDVPLIAVKL